LSSVQQGNFVANDPRWRSHLCRSINSISRRSLSSTHSHTHTTTHHTNHTHTHIHIHTQFLIRMSFSPSFVPPLSRRNLSSPLLSSLVYLRSDISIETISHRRNPTRRTAGPYTVPCDAIITRRDQRGYNIDQPDRLAKRKELVRTKGFFPILVSSRTLYIPCLSLSLSKPSKRSSLPFRNNNIPYDLDYPHDSSLSSPSPTHSPFHRPTTNP
jgi:hypothetical protein